MSITQPYFEEDLLMSDTPSPVETGVLPLGYWAADMAKLLHSTPNPADRAIILADALDACASIYRTGPFPVTVYAVDDGKMDAVRKVAQLARTVANELRLLAQALSTPSGSVG